MSIAKVYKQGGGNDPLVGAGFWEDVSAIGSKVVKGISDTFNPPEDENMKKLRKMGEDLKAMNAKRNALHANATQVKATKVAPKNTFVATAPVMASKPMTAKAQAIRQATSVMMEKIHNTAPPAVASAIDNGMAKMLEIEAKLNEITVEHFSSPEGYADITPTNVSKVKGDSAQPILCRTGTKKDIAWWLIERFDPIYKEKYVEAFFGGGAIYWQKPKSKVEVINEFNPLACDFYQRLQKGYATSPNLIPELDLYDASMKAFGVDKWYKALYDYYCGSAGRYISSTKVNIANDKGKSQIKQIDRIARIWIPWLKENPIITKTVKDKYGGKYEVILRSAKGGANDNLVCMYWYLLSFCCGQGGTANIPLEDLQCVANKPDTLVMMSGNEDAKEGEDDDEEADWKEGDAKPQMPIKKTSDPHNKLALTGRGSWYINRLKGTKIYNSDALDVCPKEDSPNAFFMLDPPYEAGGGYGIASTVEKKGGAKHDTEFYAPLRADDDPKSVFPFRAFVRMCNSLKAKVMVTINGSKNILELFQGKGDVKHSKVWYACKIWVLNKASKGKRSARFEIVYGNYKFKNAEDVNSKAFMEAPEYVIYSPSKGKAIHPVTYDKPVLPYQDPVWVGATAKGVPAGLTLKPKNEDNPDRPVKPHPCIKSKERKPPIPNEKAPFVNDSKSAVKAEPAGSATEIVVAQPVAKPKRVRKPKNTIVEPSTAEANLDNAPDLEVGLGRHRHNELRGGYYMTSNPPHLGSRMAYAPTIVADEKPIMSGGSAYETGDW